MVCIPQLYDILKEEFLHRHTAKFYCDCITAMSIIKTLAHLLRYITVISDVIATVILVNNLHKTASLKP